MSTVTALPIEKRGYSGSATWYDVGLGSCGKTNTNSQMVVALSSSLMGNKGYCGRKIKATYKGKSVTATVVDTCPGCSSGSIDLSPSAFKKLAPLDAGRVPVQWTFA
ncbi:RlpA-like double-psi beta-barrel-protein domain-containing protein-containing protein [Dichotomocladium elegans]|nr:RlpA-like double-psi beta-barrel-protein domain-containing protein-containing protein [Dichotomocladium elegans]